MDKMRYIGLRKKLLREEMKVVYERDQLSKKLRAIRDDMHQWDKALVNEED